MRQVRWGWDPHSAGGQTGGSPSRKSHRLWSWVASPHAVRPGFHSEGVFVPRNGCSCVLGMRTSRCPQPRGQEVTCQPSSGGGGVGHSSQAPGLGGQDGRCTSRRWQPPRPRQIPHVGLPGHHPLSSVVCPSSRHKCPSCSRQLLRRATQKLQDRFQ